MPAAAPRRPSPISSCSSARPIYAEGQAEALLLAAPPRTLEDEIAELKVAERVDAELEAMKARGGSRHDRFDRRHRRSARSSRSPRSSAASSRMLVVGLVRLSDGAPAAPCPRAPQAESAARSPSRTRPRPRRCWRLRRPDGIAARGARTGARPMRSSRAAPAPRTRRGTFDAGRGRPGNQGGTK